MATTSPFPRVCSAPGSPNSSTGGGLPGDWPVPPGERARIHRGGARFFAAEHGRPPRDARELAATVAEHRRTTQSPAMTSPLPGEERVDAVDSPRRRCSRSKRPTGRRRRCVDFISRRCLSAPAPTAYGKWTCRSCSRPRFHPPRPLRRRPRPAHPRGRRQQGPNAGWTLARHRRPHPVQGHRCRHRRPTTPPWKTTSATVSDSIRRTAEPGPAETTGARNRRRQLARCPVVGASATQHRNPARHYAAVPTNPRPPTRSGGIVAKLAQQATLETQEAKHEPRTLAEQRTTRFRQAARCWAGPTPST